LLRIVLLVLVGVAVFEARRDSVVVIAIAVAAALLVSARLPPRPAVRLSAGGVLRFLPFFAVHAARGGIDVALRALLPGRGVDPGYADYDIRIRHPAGRVIFANTVSLMPGTFTARLDGGRLRVHTLDAGADVAANLAAVERRVAGMFGEALA
jgi:multicomponent Na+:H+ antiporter subunit E